MINQPLDLYEIFVNTLSGSMMIFVALSLIFFAWLGAKFKMPNYIFLGFMALFVIVMGIIGGGFPWVIVSIILALVAFLIIAKPFKY
jgi:hypothetical protein